MKIRLSTTDMDKDRLVFYVNIFWATLIIVQAVYAFLVDFSVQRFPLVESASVFTVVVLSLVRLFRDLFLLHVGNAVGTIFVILAQVVFLSLLYYMLPLESRPTPKPPCENK